MRKHAILALVLALTMLVGAFPALAEKEDKSTDTSGIALMFTIIGDYLQDGGSVPVTSFGADKRAEDDFYGGTLFMYMFNNALVKDALGDKAIMPVESLDEGKYIVDEAQAKAIFTSFFGATYADDFQTIFKPYLMADGKYGFDMSDGPVPAAQVLSSAVAEDGSVTAQVSVVVNNDELQNVPVGTFDAKLSPSADSIFGYTIDSFTFTKAAA